MTYHWTLGRLNLAIRGTSLCGDFVTDQAVVQNGNWCPASGIQGTGGVEALVVWRHYSYMEVRILEIHAGHPLSA